MLANYILYFIIRMVSGKKRNVLFSLYLKNLKLEEWKWISERKELFSYKLCNTRSHTSHFLSTRKSKKKKKRNKSIERSTFPKNMKNSIEWNSKFPKPPPKVAFLSLSLSPPSSSFHFHSKISKQGREAKQNEQNFTYPCTICPGSTPVNLGLHFAHYYVS